MGRLSKIALFLLLISSLFSLFIFKNKQIAQAASPGDVVINEIMYNPNTGNQDDEFLELYNTTNDPIDIGYWQFTAGLNVTFTAGTIIPAHGYIVISPNMAQTMTTYGVTAILQYAPSNLSNGGETLTLVDGSLNQIDTVTYDDVVPWALSPDGTGPSLELKGPLLDNSVATNWGGSLHNGGTPGVENELVGVNLATISNVTDPNDVQSVDTVTITADVSGVGISSVNLLYKLNFGIEQSVAMYDDGTHGDVTGLDGQYTGQVPSQNEKTLVRFRVAAINDSGTQYNPSNNDSIDYYGYYVRPLVNTNAAVVDWFIDDADYTDMIDNHAFDDHYIPCVIVYGNEVYDNSLVRIKGDISRGDPKKNYKFKLPAGYKIHVDGTARAIGEFHMDAEANSSTMAEMPLAWWIVEQVGLPVPELRVARVQRNGEFYGMYTFIEKYEKEWRQAFSYNDGDLFENYDQPVDGPNDTAQRNAWRASLEVDRKDPALHGTILDTLDLPNIFNYQSSIALLSCWDHFSTWNSYLYRDAADTNRWSMLHWDLDSCFTMGGVQHQASPFDYYDMELQNVRFTTTVPYTDPVIRKLYFRRLKTLVDKLYNDDTILDKYQEFIDPYVADMELELEAWPVGRTSKETIQNGIRNHRNVLQKYLRTNWALPPTQTNTDRQSVTIDQINPSGTNANEYIRLRNAASTPVDLSGWEIEGINYTLPQGTVIPANDVIYVLRDDAGYRAGHDPVLVAGQYTTDLGSSGTLVLKTDTGSTIDTENY